MKFLKFIFINIFGTLLREFPLPCRPGLIKIGSPDRNSPVFITSNYCVTVERVRRILEKKHLNCYLLVANCKGINVWCAASGGHFTNSSVVSVLKTSGIEKLVDHRNVILPQLASAGIEGSVVKQKAAWNILWGPVYAKDIPLYIDNGFSKTAGMKEVDFHLGQRIEMGIMWAFPFSLIVALITLIFWPKILFPLVSVTWIVPLLIFIFFPLYSGLLDPGKREVNLSRYTVVFDFARIPLILSGVFILCILLFSILTGSFSFNFILRWGFISFLLTLLVSIDLMGSTPVYKSGLHEERLLKVKLDEGKCTGCGICEDVCPRGCYNIDEFRLKTVLSGPEKCVQCASCIVQCPTDALHFEDFGSGVIYPDTLRKYKLNLLGSRIVSGNDRL